MIESPNKGAPITAAWARKVTDAANAYNARNVKRIYPMYGSAHDSASEHPFKFCVFDWGGGDKEPKFSICLPPGSITWGMKTLDPVGDMEVAKIKVESSASGSSGSKEYDVDGRFKHVYEFKSEAGKWEKETVKIGDEQKEVQVGNVYCLIYNEAGSTDPLVAFIVAKDGDKNTLSESLKSVANEGNQLAYFLVARATKDGIEQVAKSAMTYGGASGGGEAVLCQVTNGVANGGVSVSIYGNGRGEQATGSGFLYLTEIALGAELPQGAWIIGHPILMSKTGGGVEE